MDDAVVHIEGLSKSFTISGREVTAIDDLSIDLAAGTLTGLVGPDGAGKTTLLRLMAGLERPDRGSIEVFGRDSVREAAAIQSRVGYMPQQFGLYEELTVGENLRLYADLHTLSGARRRQRLEALLAFTGLAPFAGRRAGKLSGGMKQKLGLACTLIGRPRLLLLDEPSVGVDPLSRRDLRAMVRARVSNGDTVLWSTSYLDEAAICDRVFLLNEGRLLGQGPPRQFTDRMAGRIFLMPLEGVDWRDVESRLTALPEVLDSQIQAGNMRLVLAPGAAPPELASLRPTAPRFEDAFVALLARPPDGKAGTASPTALEVSEPPPAQAGAPVIETRDLSRAFGDFLAVDRVNLAVRRGEIFGLLGPNGAGKSTTFKMLCGLLAPTAGRARVAGIDMANSLASTRAGASASVRAGFGYMSQRFSLYGDLTLCQNLDFFAGVYGLTGKRRRARVAWVLEEFGLGDYGAVNAGLLPLGYKQRLALGAALMHRPRLLFLDEPTSGIDPLSRRAFWARINALARDGVTVMVTSHFMEEAEYCDRLAIMHEGRVVASGSPSALKSAHARPGLPDPTLEDAFVALIEEIRGEAGP